MKGGNKIRKLWEIFKTHEPPNLSSSANAYHCSDDGFSLDNSQFDFIIQDIFNPHNDFDENFFYYLQFINKNSLKSVLVCNNNLFVTFLKASGITVLETETSKISDFLCNSKELFSSIVLFDSYKYFQYNDFFDLIQLAYKKIEFGGILLIELPDSLLCNECSFNPEAIERVCKEFGFRDIRTYKTPLNEVGTYKYLVIARKCYS